MGDAANYWKQELDKDTHDYEWDESINSNPPFDTCRVGPWGKRFQVERFAECLCPDCRGGGHWTHVCILETKEEAEEMVQLITG